ncbi:MAG: fimbria major subunit [Prevotellaceae bacterium]|nr:fimbria major subunit [Prevotellaceae bacterium]
MKKQILLGLLAVGMLTACSSDNSLTENVNDLDIAEGQPAFIKVGISMPGDVNSTRANDDFENGDATEYDVKSGKLVLFKGANEAAATLISAYDITPMVAFTMDGSPQVTTSSKPYVQEITSPALGTTDHLYAYVILNHTGNATGVDFSTGQTYENFSKDVFNAIGLENSTAEAAGHGAMNTTNGLVMTSVPVSSVAGGTTDASTGTVSSLAEIDKSCIYKTKAEAEAATTSTCIYVERAAAKVDVTFTATKVEDYPTMSATLLGWSLGNTNNSTSGYYNVRQVETAWGAYANIVNSNPNTWYRFVSGTAFDPQQPTAYGHREAYRTYFAKDVNYNGNTDLNNTKIAAGDYGYSSGSYTYTYENTFDENSQMYKNTTYVGFKVQLNGGSTFYKLGSTIYASGTDLETALATIFGGDNNSIVSDAADAITTAIATDYANSSGVIRGTYSISTGNTLTFDYKLTADITSVETSTGIVKYTVKVEITNAYMCAPGDVPAPSPSLKNAINTLASSLLAEDLTTKSGAKTVEALCYTDGIAYYAARIAHFGNNETPWSAPNSAYNDYSKIYPTTGISTHTSPATPVTYTNNTSDVTTSHARAWLGRWGVVRNNWYSLTAGKVVGIGSPVPVEYKDDVTPDDNPETYYIAAHIHILPWAKRTQNVDLK